MPFFYLRAFYDLKPVKTPVVSILFICAAVLSGSAQDVGALSDARTQFDSLLQLSFNQRIADSINIETWRDSVHARIQSNYLSEARAYQSRIDSLQTHGLSTDAYLSQL
jgi:hypothetical protein